MRVDTDDRMCVQGRANEWNAFKARGRRYDALEDGVKRGEKKLEDEGKSCGRGGKTPSHVLTEPRSAQESIDVGCGVLPLLAHNVGLVPHLHTHDPHPKKAHLRLRGSRPFEKYGGGGSGLR